MSNSNRKVGYFVLVPCPDEETAWEVLKEQPRDLTGYVLKMKYGRADKLCDETKVAET